MRQAGSGRFSRPLISWPEMGDISACSFLSNYLLFFFIYSCYSPQQWPQLRCQPPLRHLSQRHLASQASTIYLLIMIRGMTPMTLLPPAYIITLVHWQVVRIASLKAGNLVRVPSCPPVNVQGDTQRYACLSMRQRRLRYAVLSMPLQYQPLKPKEIYLS